MSPASLSNRKAKALSMKQNRKDRKNRRKDLQHEIRDSLPFPVPHKPRLHLVLSKYGPKQQAQLPKSEWPALTLRNLETIPHNSTITHAAIPNPNYVSGADVPRYVAIRFANCVSMKQREALLEHVKLMRKLKVRFNTTAAHGEDFLQAWFGIWMKYQPGPFFSASRRPTKQPLDSAVTESLVTLDEDLKGAAKLLGETDPSTYNLMRQSNKYAARAVFGEVASGTHNFAKLQQKWMDKDPNRTRTSSYRMGGIGSMLAVSISTGNGTGYHYDSGDDGHFYSMILVLGKGGHLKLPETGLQLYVKPGDVVFFLANQQLHKLDIDDDSPDSAGSQTVFTIWTDKQTMRYSKPDLYANPKYKDFHCVEQNDTDVENIDDED